MTTPTPYAPPSSNHPDWSKTLEWIEKQAQESMKARYATADLLSKEAQVTLTVLLAAVGGTTAYAAKIIETGPAAPTTIASAISCAYLVMLSVVLVLQGMTFRSFPALHQQPENLMHKEYSLDEIREAELINLEQRISEAAVLNAKRAKLLNRIRIAAAVTPAIFLCAAFFSQKQAQELKPQEKIFCRPAPTAPDPYKIICEIPKLPKVQNSNHLISSE